MNDPIHSALEAAANQIAAQALARAKKSILAALDKAIDAALTPAAKSKPARAKRVAEKPKAARRRGESGIRGFSSLSPAERVDVEAAIRQQKETDAAIARRFNVHQPQVSGLRRKWGLPAVGVKFGPGQNAHAPPPASTPTPPTFPLTVAA
jgi:hypothetical protein